MSVSLMAHETAHGLAASAGGATGFSLSSVGPQGDWSALAETAVVPLGVSGSLANVLLALLGWLGFRRGVGRPTTVTLLFWLLFVVNAWTPTVHLIVSPLFEFGDWMIIIDRFPNRGPMRASIGVSGLFITGVLWKGTVVSLAQLVGNGPSAERRSRAVGIAGPVWAAAGGVVIAAASLSRADLPSALAIAVGGSVGSLWPILLAARRVGENPVPGSPLVVGRSAVIMAAAVVVAAVLLRWFGPGFGV